jgi:Spy/CpxP family protein refolding chaperone
MLAVAGSPLAAPALAAQEVPDYAFAQHVFPPELVMQHQQKIGLRPDQREAITEAIQQLQAKVVELQWRMQDESQKLAEILQRPRVDEGDALAQVDRVLSVEREVKRAHMTMLIRIKNTLTPEQQAMLKTLR